MAFILDASGGLFPNTLGRSQKQSNSGVSCHVNEVALELLPLGWGLVVRATSQVATRGLELLTPPPDLLGGARLGVNSLLKGQ